MNPDKARRYVEVLDLYAGDLEALVEETRAEKPGLTSAMNPHLHDMAHGVATVREKITADAENMTRMIAGMREEWGAERQVRGRWVRIVFALNTLWTDDRAIAESAVDDCRDLGLPARIVRRYVTEPEAEA